VLVSSDGPLAMSTVVNLRKANDMEKAASNILTVTSMMESGVMMSHMVMAL